MLADTQIPGLLRVDQRTQFRAQNLKPSCPETVSTARASGFSNSDRFVDHRRRFEHAVTIVLVYKEFNGSRGIPWYCRSLNNCK